MKSGICIFVLIMSVMVIAVPLRSAAQNATIHVTVSDTIGRKSLGRAVVSLLNAKDSTFVKFARTGNTGYVSLVNVPPGSYCIVVSYPHYADYSEAMQLKAGEVLDKKVALFTKEVLLREVVVKSSIPALRYRGDTMEFKADSFRVIAGASVEDLLRQIPGMSVDSRGNVQIQGKRVEKILVDGEEFFGDDPTLVTRNLRAVMIDKIQVYDKKSEVATLTGVDDGKKTKTINLALKKEAKSGYFGKLSGGLGTQRFFEGQAMVNLFRKKEKIAAYFISANTGKTNLSFQEQNLYGDNRAGFDARTTDDLDTWSGGYDNRGIPSVNTAGLHYDNKWNGDRLGVNGNYRHLSLNIDGDDKTSTRFLLGSGISNYRDSSTFRNELIGHKVNFSTDVILTPSSTVKFFADHASNRKKTLSDYSTSFYDEHELMLNGSHRRLTAQVDQDVFNAAMSWQKKMKKKGRFIFIHFKPSVYTSVSQGYLWAQNVFYQNNPTSVSTETIDQYKSNNTRYTNLDLKATYNEPIDSFSYLVFSWGTIINNNTTFKNTLNKSFSGKYDMIDGLLSNSYRYNVLSNRGGIGFVRNRRKLYFSLAADIGIVALNQNQIDNPVKTTRRFYNFFPQASFVYTINKQQRLSGQYSGATVQPGLLQIQPVYSNLDPFNIVKGNQNLLPSFFNTISVTYSDARPLSARYFTSRVNYDFTLQSIVVNDNIDMAGRRVSQFVNGGTNRSLSIFANYTFAWKKQHINFETAVNGIFGKSQNFVNTQYNETRERNLQASIYAGKAIANKYMLSILSSFQYTHIRSSILPNSSIDFRTLSIRPNFQILFSKKIQLSNEIESSFRQKIGNVSPDVNVVLWNAALGMYFTKTNSLQLKISVNDILNQNKGIYRSASYNYFTERMVSTIKRYVLVSCIYNFNHQIKTSPTQK